MPALKATLMTLATQIPAGTLTPDASRRGWAMFALVTLLGITLVATAGVLALLSARRRRRRRHQRPVRAADPRDPWAVSSERMVEVKGRDPTE